MIEVSSQKMKSVHTVFAHTRPTIAVEKASRVAANRPMLVALGDEVAVRVDAHERTDARHEHRQQRSHRIDAELHRQVEAGHPLESGGDHVAGSETGRRPDGGDRHRHGRQPQCGTAETPSDEGEGHDDRGVQSEQEPDQQTRMIRLDLFASQH